MEAQTTKVTWDEFARQLSIEPRAMKSYRMPETSLDFRSMPNSVKAGIELKLAKLAKGEAVVSKMSARDEGKTLLSSLAALVVRQARAVYVDQRIISGVSLIPGSTIGLTRRDREAMALVSKFCLLNNLEDHGAGIHDLLAQCCRPFSQWLPIAEVRANGLEDASLIQPEEMVPTPEAEELARGVGDIAQTLEEALFAKFMELLSRSAQALGDRFYTSVREFVVRHPICTLDELQQMSRAAGLNSLLSMVVQQQFYEPIPDSWAQGNEGLPVCDHCRNAMRRSLSGLMCRSRACNGSNSPQSSASIPVDRALRVTRGISQYWVEPGIDEIRLFDQLMRMGLDPVLYPCRDRVDIAFGDVGIDLKAYVSPETLGYKLQRSPGGLSFYARKWLVVPDWLIHNNPTYLERLERAVARPDIECISVARATALAAHVGLAHA